jgi:integrase
MIEEGAKVGAGLPGIGLHYARHTSATLMLVQGIPVKVASDILGHSSSRVTLDIYAHIYEEGRQDAANKIDEIFGAQDASEGVRRA